MTLSLLSKESLLYILALKMRLTAHFFAQILTITVNALAMHHYGAQSNQCTRTTRLSDLCLLILLITDIKSWLFLDLSTSLELF